jgi:AraC-like DNA-binding protein
MGGEEPAELTPMAALIQPPPWERMPVIRHGGDGAATHVVCGYLICDHPLFDPRLRALPPVFVVRPPEGPARDWVRASITYAMQQTALVARDRFEAPTTIPELLLLEVLKLHLSATPGDQTGWLHALRDPVLAPALAAIHTSPERKWNLLSLAREASVSVSLLDERFREALGLAPIRYLAAWRMHVAKDLIRSSELGVAAVAHRVGYDSEASATNILASRPFGSVTDLLAPPTVLMQPRLMWRVVKNRRRKEADKGARRLSRYPSTATVARPGSPPPRPHLGRDEHNSHKVG